MSTVIVIGGGIGGLTAAAALKRAGWEVTVIERTATLTPVGSGLGVGPNGLRALDMLGIGDAVRARARFAGDGGLRTARGRYISRVSAEAAAQRYGDPTVVLMRSDVVDLLRDLLADVPLHTGISATAISARDGKVSTTAGQEQADLVVAADGINSLAREALFPDHPGPRYSGVTAWRFLTRRSGIGFGESWGRGKVFGVSPVSGGMVYCYATNVIPAGSVSADEIADLTAGFGDWHDPIPGLIANADPATVLRNEIWHLRQPLPRLHQGRVAVLGDAAHAMTPNLGQGANQAMEDAIVLAHEMTHGGGLPAYTAARLGRVTAIARQSYKVSRMTAIKDPVRVALRDAAVWAVGKLGPNVLLRQGDAVYRWEAPQADTAIR